MNELQIVKLENTDISGWDFAMLRAEIQSRLDFYSALVYTDENIKDAKNDRTTLNKVKKIIDDARKAYKSRCLAPYEALEPQIKELVDMIERQRALIDDTVKNYEDRQRAEKEQEIRRYYDRKSATLGDFADRLSLMIFDKKWTNVSTTKAKYEEEILEAINRAASDIESIREMNSPFADTLLSLYCETLSMAQVTAKREELENAAKKASLVSAADPSVTAVHQKDDPSTHTQTQDNNCDGILIRVEATQSQLAQITDFMKAIGVHYEVL